MTAKSAINARSMTRLVLPVVLAWTVFQGCRIKEYDVAPTGLAVTPPAAIRALGANQEFVAVVTYSDDSTHAVTAQAAWTSSDASVASVDGGGVATPVGPGTTTITASWQGMTGSATLTVSDAQLASIAVTPAAPSIANGTRQQFTATGHYDDGSDMDITTSVTWTSSDAGVSMSASGLASSTALGSATSTITATKGGISGAAVLTVKGVTLDSVSVTPQNRTINVGGQQLFAATGSFSDGTTQDLTGEVAWSSSGSAAAVDPATPGRVTGAAAGTATITATSSALLGSKAGSTSLTVLQQGY